jgi:hypothetical protein
MYTRLAVVLFVLMAIPLLLVACGQSDDESDDWGGDGLCDACLDAAPNPEDLTLTIPGDDEVAAKSTGGLGQMATLYHDTVDISRSLNYHITAHLGFLDEILSYPPSARVGQYCIWGPFIDNGLSPVETQFKMRQASATTFDYYWQQRPKNTTVDFVDIWYGDIEPSTTTNRRGIGTLFLDYTLAQQLDPTLDPTGQMEVAYDTFTDDARAIDITFTDFSFNAYDMPTDAAYHYLNNGDNSGDFEFSIQMNIHSDAENLPELENFAYLTQWQGTGSGVSTVTISGGDIDATEWPVSPGTYMAQLQQFECWNDDFERTYYEETLFLDDGSDVEIESEGDPSTCVF